MCDVLAYVWKDSLRRAAALTLDFLLWSSHPSSAVCLFYFTEGGCELRSGQVYKRKSRRRRDLRDFLERPHIMALTRALYTLSHTQASRCECFGVSAFSQLLKRNAVCASRDLRSASARAGEPGQQAGTRAREVYTALSAPPYCNFAVPLRICCMSASACSFAPGAIVAIFSNVEMACAELPIP